MRTEDDEELRERLAREAVADLKQQRREQERAAERARSVRAALTPDEQERLTEPDLADRRFPLSSPTANGNRDHSRP
jgi:hypothetical protein